MPTNRVTKGNSLQRLVLQPGWSVEDDGFGLLTCRATYIQSHGNDAGTSAGDVNDALKASPKRGDRFIKDSRLSCHRASSSANANGLLVVTAEYVGIANGNMTIPQVSGRGATSTEPIASHPAWQSKVGGTSSSPKNGAVYNDDGSFKTFGDVTNRKYGVKSYLDPAFNITGHFFTVDLTVAGTLKNCVCTTSSDGQWKNIQLVGKLNALATNAGTSWAGVMAWSAADESPQLLLTGLGIEDYGTLVKVNYDITVSLDGWDIDIYPYATQGRATRENKS